MQQYMPDIGVPPDMLRFEQVHSEDDWKQIQYEVFQRNCPDTIDAQSILNRPFNSAKLQIMEKYIPRDRQCKILELGCFTASFGEYFAKQGHDVVAVDVPEILAVTQRDINVTFRAVDLNHAFPEGMYDVILCTQLIEHMPRDFELLKSIIQHLNPGGLAFVDTTTAMPRAEDFYKVAHIRAYPGYSLQALMRTAGFDIVLSAHIRLKQTGDENALVIGRRP